MSYLDDLLGKQIQIGGVNLPMRKILNLLGSITAADNPGTGSTDVTFGVPSTGAISGAGTVTLTTGDAGKTLSNTGAVQWNLPAAAAGLFFRVINDNAGGTTIKALGSDVLRFSGLSSSGGGTMQSSDLDASVLIAAVAGKWVSIGEPAGGWSKT